MRSKDKILGVLYGQAIGDAIGMPSELWPVENIRDQFGGKITTFLDGPDNNDIAKNFKKGQYTDDTNQALAILDGLIENNWQPNSEILVKHIMAGQNQSVLGRTTSLDQVVRLHCRPSKPAKTLARLRIRH